MSTRDPDDVRRALGARLQPLAVPVGIIGVAAGPVIALLYWAAGSQPMVGPAAILAYLLISTGAGILIYWLPKRPGPLAIASYTFAYLGGLLAVLAAGSANDPTVPITSYALLAGAYLIATVLAALQWLRTQAVRLTMERGIDTVGTVTRSGVDGVGSYVQYQRLTIKFTDNTGTQRWLRVGKTGGDYSTGDSIPVRYDPERPWSKRSIVVGN